jgi:hypothetical protein
MDVPNDLNKLLARLKEVSSDTGRMPAASASGTRPSAVEIGFFLSQYHFETDATIDDLTLLAMWPTQKRSTEETG